MAYLSPSAGRMEACFILLTSHVIQRSKTEKNDTEFSCRVTQIEISE